MIIHSGCSLYPGMFWLFNVRYSIMWMVQTSTSYWLLDTVLSLRLCFRRYVSPTIIPSKHVGPAIPRIFAEYEATSDVTVGLGAGTAWAYAASATWALSDPYFKL
ncbi:hypothetical protein M405DRAFT_463472 [Rhizopogon salebrosus TDB-379]|nr:hypothetical protein M405DRAFT_463472 [Rhizopogon salebrosus TDB-379]